MTFAKAVRLPGMLLLLGLGHAHIATAQKTHLTRFVAGVDTFDTYLSRADGVLHQSAGYYVRTVANVNGHWELTNLWVDSAGAVTRQFHRTAAHSLATEREEVRAPTDSASVLIAAGRITGWVVPAGKPAHLIAATTSDEWLSGDAFILAAAAARPGPGQRFVANTYNMYAANPLEPTADTLRAVRRAVLHARGVAIPVVVMERSNGSSTWFEQATGRVLLRRGHAGPNAWWWHIRRGIQPPDVVP